jgi:HD-GYP domain-containing protein (c-di-GMP phosphodiesterase class II)
MLGACRDLVTNQAAGRRDAPACVLYSGFDVASESCDALCRPAEQLLADGAAATLPSVLLVDATLVARVGDAHAVAHHVVIVAADQAAEAALGRRADISLAGMTDAAARRAILSAACQTAIARFSVMLSEAEFKELSRIGIALMGEHDRKALLRLIVAQCKQLTHSDGCGLLLLIEDEKGNRWLRPVLYGFDSIDADFLDPSTRYPVDERSVIGHATLAREPVVISDAYDLPPEALFEMNLAFDVRYGYRRRSMLAIPMIDQLDRVLGILVCINRKTDPNAKITGKEDADRYVIDYSNREVRLTQMLASHAAVAIENARLYAQVQSILESFVQASVSAIDLRDPATAGHSLRVAALVGGLAAAVERKEDGPYRDVHFTSKQMRELRFAALLHDFGKIAVREDLLLKAKKLPPTLWERIDARFDLIGRTMELESCRAHAGSSAAHVDGALVGRLKELDRLRQVVRTANEPTVLDAPTATELLAIARCTYERPDGTVAPYLTPEELHYLQLPKGTLDDRERAEVESHVTATRRFLSNVPWTDDLKDMVTYAYGHHELLNGKGYPERLRGDQIPLQTRLIAVADVFDALTASDRTYKPAVSPETALEMLRAEAAAGRLDAELVKVMDESESYRHSTTTDEHEL